MHSTMRQMLMLFTTHNGVRCMPYAKTGHALPMKDQRMGKGVGCQLDPRVGLIQPRSIGSHKQNLNVLDANLVCEFVCVCVHVVCVCVCVFVCM